MTVVKLSLLETILGGFGPVDSGAVEATYWAGRGPYLGLVGDEVRYSTAIRVSTSGGPVSMDMTPTGGVCCVRWSVRNKHTGATVYRYTSIPDVPEVAFGDLVDVDPLTFEPSESGQAAWDATLAEVQALVDQVAANTITATLDPADDDVLLITFPSYQTDPDDGSILVLPIGE